jgi:chromosome segregation ATPase
MMGYSGCCPVCARSDGAHSLQCRQIQERYARPPAIFETVSKTAALERDLAAARERIGELEQASREGSEDVESLEKRLLVARNEAEALRGDLEYVREGLAVVTQQRNELIAADRGHWHAKAEEYLGMVSGVIDERDAARREAEELRAENKFVHDKLDAEIDTRCDWKARAERLEALLGEALGFPAIAAVEGWRERARRALGEA